jgi:hypothetical protein
MNKNYHNLRDANGRFTKKVTVVTKSVTKKKPSKKVNKEIYDLFILDKSSSMSSIKTSTINGYNEILAGIQKVSKDTKIPSYCSLVEFSYNSMINSVFNNLLCENVKGLNDSNFRPSGMTALHDAIGFGINQLKSNLGAKLNDKNISVTVSILTDGEENNSSKYNQYSIKELIETMKNDYNWTINFIGAGNKDKVQAVADSIGIFASNTINYSADSVGTTTVFRNIAKSRSAKSVTYATTGENNNFGFFSND